MVARLVKVNKFYKNQIPVLRSKQFFFSWLWKLRSVLFDYKISKPQGWGLIFFLCKRQQNLCFFNKKSEILVRCFELAQLKIWFLRTKIVNLILFDTIFFCRNFLVTFFHDWFRRKNISPNEKQVFLFSILGQPHKSVQNFYSLFTEENFLKFLVTF